jgi:Holliday junction resolvasome RuvABC endonuclease subunit
MIVLGIDSAELSGWARVERGSDEAERLIDHGTITVRTAGDVEAAVGQLVVGPLDVVAIEEPFYSPKFPGAGLQLSRLLGRWQQELERRGLTTLTVPAAMWQTRILPGVTHRSRSAERKAAAQAFALERYGVKVGEDAADAIALATYVARTATRRAA